MQVKELPGALRSQVAGLELKPQSSEGSGADVSSARRCGHLKTAARQENSL